MAIRIGLLGAGSAGRAHLESLAANPEAQVVGICDNNRARAEAAAERVGASVHINYRSLLESERLDALIVCVPPFARSEPECAAALAGIHLLLEPPVALSVEKARQIQKEIEKAGVVASVAFPWRYLSGTDRARELLKDRRTALVRGLRLGAPPRPGWRRKRESCGGQMLLDAAHLLDLARFLAGDVASVFAVQSQGIVAAGAPDYDIEDASIATLRFRSGATGEIIAAAVAPREESLLSVIAGELELRITPESLEVVEAGKRTIERHSAPATQPAGKPGLAACQAAFLEAVKSGEPALVRSSFGDAARTLEVALAANESAQTGKVVNL